MRAVAISATTGAGVPALLAAIDDVLPMDPLVRTRLDLSAGDGATLAMIHEFGRVLSTHYEGDRVVVEAEVPESLERRLSRPLSRSDDPQVCGKLCWKIAPVLVKVLQKTTLTTN